VLQRTAASRLAVQSGKSYNVYFRLKAENWVTPEHRDAVHYQIVWRNAAGAVLDRIFSHPHWIYPQPYWYSANLGHPEGKDDSVTLVRLSPPSGAATLDVRVGWVRNSSGEPNPDGVFPNPPGSLLYVDDLVVDAVQAGAVAPKVEISVTGGKVSVTFTGILESSTAVDGPYVPVVGAVSPYPVDVTGSTRFFRSR